MTDNNKNLEIEIVDTTPEIEVVEESMVVDEPEVQTVEITEEEINTPLEYSEWQSPEDFEQYVVVSARNIPPIYKDSKNSMRRAFAYMEKLSEEIATGVSQDAPYAELTETNFVSLMLSKKA